MKQQLRFYLFFHSKESGHSETTANSESTKKIYYYLNIKSLIHKKYIIAIYVVQRDIIETRLNLSLMLQKYLLT